MGHVSVDGQWLLGTLEKIGSASVVMLALSAGARSRRHEGTGATVPEVTCPEWYPHHHRAELGPILDCEDELDAIRSVRHLAV
jgi:hypothetical protein